MAKPMTYLELRDARRLAILRGDHGRAERLLEKMRAMLDADEVTEQEMLASQVL